MLVANADCPVPEIESHVTPRLQFVEWLDAPRSLNVLSSSRTTTIPRPPSAPLNPSSSPAPSGHLQLSQLQLFTF